MSAQSEVVQLLLDVALKAYMALDDSEERQEGSLIPAEQVIELQAALEALDDLPAEPGYASCGPNNARYAIKVATAAQDKVAAICELDGCYALRTPDRRQRNGFRNPERRDTKERIMPAGIGALNDIYMRLTYEQYKNLEQQLQNLKTIESTHRTVDGGYHKAFRLQVTETLVIEFMGPLVKAPLESP